MSGPEPSSNPSPARARPTRSPAPAAPDPKRTPAFAIAVVLGLIGFFYVVAKLPFEGDPGFVKRLGTGCVALLAGLMIYSGARALVESVLKAAIEVLAVVVFLLNALAAAMVIVWKRPITAWAVDAGFSEEHAFWQAVLLLAGGVFLVDALIFLLLYPLSRVVGTHLKID